ncbi:MFS transporter [[Mycobacterium] holstebronense]|uniref:MFS transporter n=1 Tax=[Mycobacterium] holstebronense TaxID=3064288 RepID=A0ABM9LYJ6_9MYCO|nr:MFS transporter [Mycolicibacter sp. MU0102]CAJ1506955.1 MFS transporter [Mycolicibacter sp. MU0102]
MTVAAEPGTRSQQLVQLLLATWTSIICFWAWNLVGPLSTQYATQMSLSPNQQALMVATPILVGALGRIGTGLMTDRFGGRTMFIGVSLASIVPVLVVGYAAKIGSYPLMVGAGFLLGVAGTVFAIGIPFANNWFAPERRGFATGVFGMGMAGTAASAFFTPRFVKWFGLFATHLIVAVALAATALLCFVVMRNGPQFVPNTASALPKLKAAAKLRVTWEMSILYALVFGGFVAFCNYLPIYIKTIYDFSAVDAGERTAAFAMAAVFARLLGGTLADHIAPKYVVLAALAGIAAQTVMAVLHPPADLWTGLTFIPLAVALGIGTGGVFAWVSRRVPAGSIGSVTGIVAAVGGLGGYFPPLVMGATYDPVHNNYTVALMMLVATAVILFGYTVIFLHARESLTSGST